MFKKKFPVVIQHDLMDCGPACLKMVAEYYGKRYSLEYLRGISYLTREGVSLLDINTAAEAIGFRTLMAKVTYEKLVQDCPLPCILHWNQHHFTVLYKADSKGAGKDRLLVADPGHGLVNLDKESFLKSWLSSADDKGVVLVLEPTLEFAGRAGVADNNKGIRFLFRYLMPHRNLVFQVLIGMCAISLISLILPFLTQVLVDFGIANRSIGIIVLILVAQLFLFFGRTTIDIIRNWLVLHISTRISLNIISDFLMKLLRLPIRFFDSKGVGDLTQRISDHHRIEIFLTSTSVDSLFSLINILIFSSVLGFYSTTVLLVFMLFSILGVGWILLFQKRRKVIDYKRFQRNKENQDSLIELISGMAEIKLNGSETSKRWAWERLQIKLFHVNIKSLAIEQYQKTGFIFFTQIKNIVITFIAAKLVVDAQLTLGGLLSISYIIGQTNGPLDQLVSFFQSAQDAKISLERLQEIHNKDNEEAEAADEQTRTKLAPGEPGSIHLQDVSFRYGGPHSPFALKNVSLTIPQGKVTAIVGASGSGKTTLMKLLLSFYEPTSGNIIVGNQDLSTISQKDWRQHCGTVLQDGFIFTDTIARNIAVDGAAIDAGRFENAVNVSNLTELISRLPLRFTTKIGTSGIGLSGGQRQRVLIARAVYKNPRYLFFDEATSALDANNERVIMHKLDNFFRNKTVVIIAHRLSTVKNADQIIVLDQGRVVESGSHNTLKHARGHYFTLVQNQLELGE